MRNLSILFSLYILCLIVAPCLDEHGITALSGSENACHHDKDHADTDKCSPFCTCSCCSSPVLAQQISTFFYTTDLPVVFQCEPAISFVSCCPASVWQPPNKA
ncbi:MAG: hypothetical protein U0T82_17010 [Bacteroidales bacterium]